MVRVAIQERKREKGFGINSFGRTAGLLEYGQGDGFSWQQ